MKLDEIIKLEQKYYSPVFKRQHVCFTRGEDVYLYDTEGKKYTDFLSGIAVCCLGYSDEGYKQALKSTIDSVMHTTNLFYNEPQSKLAELLCKAANHDNVFLTNSGAEAVEGAIKLARKYHYDLGSPRTQFVTLKNSFHGRTLATLAATGQEKFHKVFKPLVESFTYASPNDIDALNKTVSDKTAAVIIEPIIGEGGLLPITPEYYQAVRAACDKHGALMIADEIQTGMGRTGEFLASPALGAAPDITILAKALGGGVPVGAFLARGKAASVFGPGDHGSTFGGNQLACAAAYYVTNKLVNTDMFSYINETGAYFKNKLLGLGEKSSLIKDVRGRGLMLGIELIETTSAAEIQQKLLAAGFVTATAGNNVLRFLPPYVIQKSHIDELIDTLADLLCS